MKKITLPLLCLVGLMPSLAFSQEYECNNFGKDLTPIAMGDVVSCYFEEDQDTDVFVLSTIGLGASQISIRVSPPGGSCDGLTDFKPAVQVVNSANEVLTDTGVDTPAISEFCSIGKVSVSVEENQTYSLVVSGKNERTPTAYTLELQCISGACASLPLPDQCISEFDGQTLSIPYVNVDGLNYWATLKLISSPSSPFLLFQLEDAGEP